MGMRITEETWKLVYGSTLTEKEDDRVFRSFFISRSAVIFTDQDVDVERFEVLCRNQYSNSSYPIFSCVDFKFRGMTMKELEQKEEGTV